MKPQIGEVRFHYGPQIPVLYPGERAVSIVTSSVIDAAVSKAVAAGKVEIVMAGWDCWLVEPEPGLAAWWRRWRYRLIGQWLDR